MVDKQLPYIAQILIKSYETALNALTVTTQITVIVTFLHVFKTFFTKRMHIGAYVHSNRK